MEQQQTIKKVGYGVRQRKSENTPKLDTTPPGFTYIQIMCSVQHTMHGGHHLTDEFHFVTIFIDDPMRGTIRDEPFRIGTRIELLSNAFLQIRWESQIIHVDMSKGIQRRGHIDVQMKKIHTAMQFNRRTSV